MDLPKLQKVVFAIGSALWSSLRDLLPIIPVVLFFQLVVFRQPLPQAGKLCWTTLFETTATRRFAS